MATNAEKIIPARATHPGAVLKSELVARGIKQKDFAKALGMPAPNLSELIKGKRNISENIAIRLEKELGIPFQTWINLQSRYNYVVKKREEADSAEVVCEAKERDLRLRLNIADLYKFYGIDSPAASGRLKELKARINTDTDGLRNLENNTAGYFKRSDRLRIDETNMRTWLLLASSEASKVSLKASYARENCMVAARKIADAANNGTVTKDLIKEILEEAGIVYVHIPKLDAAPIDAYSTMIGSCPAIVITYRHNNADKLVFDVLHELGHIYMHLTSGKSFISVENEYSSTPEEKEADEFANDCLISPETWKSIMSVRTKSLSPHVIVHTVAEEAGKHGINPTIAVARYKHETKCYNIRGYRSPGLV